MKSKVEDLKKALTGLIRTHQKMILSDQYSDNPYKELKWVYKIKNKDIQEEVALEMDGKIYVCEAHEKN